jgi:3-oxoacyl-[acyl-carrier protein] reductase
MTSSRPLFSLSGRVALVTGSTAGLGRATAACLGRAGARVAINYARSRERAMDALAALRAEGVTAEGFQADVTREDSVDALVTDVERTLGPVDILVVNATPAQPFKLLEHSAWDEHQSLLEFFVKSPFLLARRCAPAMKRRRFGRIINITSEAFDTGPAGASAYVAAKGGQTGWTRSISRELAPYGVTVNAISPGWIPVERHRDQAEAGRDAYLSTIPTARWGRPDEVGWAAVYLASDEASFVTGQTLAINGGRTY